MVGHVVTDMVKKAEKAIGRVSRSPSPHLHLTLHLKGPSTTQEHQVGDKPLALGTLRKNIPDKCKFSLGTEQSKNVISYHLYLLFSAGTHYFRGINNLQQPWNSWIGRKKHELKPNNPTEEGLASIHSVLFRKDPFLWRAALLYYTVYQASQMSFCELFKDIGRFVKDPNTRWDYCVRAKRGWTDTSQPGKSASEVGLLTLVVSQ